jgi:DNA adenine methylase
MTRMHALFRYPGGKSKLAENIYNRVIKQFPKDPIYCDPFVGGGSVMLYLAKKLPNIPIICNDKDIYMATFWKILTGSEGEYNRLREKLDIIPTIQQFFYERNLQRSGSIVDPVHIAFHAVFFHKTTYNGMFHGNPIGGKEQKSKWTVGCRYTPKNFLPLFDNVREMLVEREYPILVYNTEATSIISMFGKNNDVVFYIDPPYFSTGDILYPVKMLPKEHEHLSDILKTQKRWILSYDDVPDIEKLYSFANIEKIEFTYTSTSTKGENTRVKKCKMGKELIITPRVI